MLHRDGSYRGNRLEEDIELHFLNHRFQKGTDQKHRFSMEMSLNCLQSCIEHGSSNFEALKFRVTRGSVEKYKKTNSRKRTQASSEECINYGRGMKKTMEVLFSRKSGRCRVR